MDLAVRGDACLVEDGACHIVVSSMAEAFILDDIVGDQETSYVTSSEEHLR